MEMKERIEGLEKELSRLQRELNTLDEQGSVITDSIMMIRAKLAEARLANEVRQLWED